VDGGRREAKLNLLVKKSDIEIDQHNPSIQKLVFKPKKGQSIKELDLKQTDQHNRPRQESELYRDSVTRFFTSGFFHESVSPQPQRIPLGPFQIFSKIRGDIRK
jgi:hypothetical protein